MLATGRKRVQRRKDNPRYSRPGDTQPPIGQKLTWVLPGNPEFRIGCGIFFGSGLMFVKALMMCLTSRLLSSPANLERKKTQSVVSTLRRPSPHDSSNHQFA